MTFIPSQLLQKTAFDQLSVESEIAEIQTSARYDAFRKMSTLVSGTSSVSSIDGEWTAKSGTTAGSLAVIFSERQIICRTGQGSVLRFDARFDAAQANTRQLVGTANAGNAVYFGYEGLEFGVIHNHGGGVKIYELTFTVSATGAETADVVIDGTTFPISINATASLSATATSVSAELNTAVPLYNFTQNGDTVVVRSVLADPAVGAFTYTATGGGTAVGAFVQISDGVLPTENFIKQADWNRDTFDDLVHANINFYTIRFNGDVEYYITDPVIGPVLVHKLENPNTDTNPLFGLAAFRNAYVATATGAATEVTVRGSTTSAFIEGDKIQTEESNSSNNTKTSVGATATNVLTIRCREVYGTRVNLGRLLPIELTAFTDGNKGAILEIFKNPDVAGMPNFSYIDKDNSITEIDTAGTTVTGGLLVASFIVTSAGRDIAIEKQNEVILPGDIFVFAMRVPSGAAADMSIGFIWEEEL